MFSLLGWTKSSPVTVFKQISSRIFILFLVFPFCDKGYFGVFQACLLWAYAEVVRFTYYTLKLIGIDGPYNAAQIFCGHLRYNSFLFAYPIGISGELFCCYHVWSKLSKLKPEERPFSFQMPNAFNFGSDFAIFLAVFVTVAWGVSSPVLYMHMLSQRRKYYEQQAKERLLEAMKVPN